MYIYKYVNVYIRTQNTMMYIYVLGYAYSDGHESLGKGGTHVWWDRMGGLPSASYRL